MVIILIIFVKRFVLIVVSADLLRFERNLGDGRELFLVRGNIKIIKSFLNTTSISDEIARKMYYKLLFLRFLPEIKAIKEGKIKVLKGKEIDKFLLSLEKTK